MTRADNPAGVTRFGTGDFLAQAALIDTVTKRFAWGFGTHGLSFPPQAKTSSAPDDISWFL
jgi:hypothetical protein